MTEHVRLAFGPFNLDPHARLLTRDGVVVPLAPRTYDVLHALASSNGRLLTKHELLHEVWGDVNVEEASVAFQVSLLRKALGEHGPAWIETVPKHGYRFTAAVERGALPRTDGMRVAGAPSPSRTEEPRPAPFRRGARALTVVGLALPLAVVLLVSGRRAAPVSDADSLPDIRPLTSDLAWQDQPGLSPDGTDVAYAWSATPGAPTDVYVQKTSGGTPTPLTADARAEHSPAWSPDGKLIAFTRETPSAGEVVVIPADGGEERVVARGSDTWVPSRGRGQAPSWFPSSRALAVVGHPATGGQHSLLPGRAGPARIYHVPLDGGEARPLTTPPPLTWGDGLPSVSPDGRYLLFARSLTRFPASSEAYLVRLDSSGRPEGSEEPLLGRPFEHEVALSHREGLRNLGWTSDSRHVLFTQVGLWMVPLAGPRVPRLIPTPGHGPKAFSVARTGGTLAFATGTGDLDIFELPGPTAPDTFRNVSDGGHAVASSVAVDSNPDLSRDGRRLAFTSDRGGTLQIWVGDADGSNLRAVTDLKGWNGGARWSPDGRHLVYHTALARTNADIYVVPSMGGPSRRLTTDPGFDHFPSWSADGRWIYFTSNRTGEYQVWKTGFPSGPTMQVTRSGGVTAFESHDGRWLYFAKWDARLWRLPVSGGQEERVLEPAHHQFWGLYDGGACATDPRLPDIVVQCIDFVSGRTSVIARFPNRGRVHPTGVSFTVSPDGRRILYTRFQRETSDIMLLEHFDRFLRERGTN